MKDGDFFLINLDLIILYPRESVKFAKKYFNGKEIVAVEIGSLEGEHAFSILKNLNVKKLYIIDPYEDYENYREGRNQKSLSKAELKCRKRLKNYKEKIIFVKKYSDDAIKEIPKVDYIYIDGNHDYEFVINDLKNYFPKVRENGIVAGHDIQADGVSKALLEFSLQNKIVPQFGDRRDWFILKK